MRDETLADVGLKRLSDDVARRLGGSSAPVTLARPRKPRQRAAAASRRPHSLDDYLLAIDALTSPIAACGALIADVPTLAAHVSACSASAGPPPARCSLVWRSPGSYAAVPAGSSC